MRMPAFTTIARATLVLASMSVVAGEDPEVLDKKFGTLQLPAYIKHYEATPGGKVLLNPYLQVATKDYPALLNPKHAPYNWVIDGEGRICIIQEAAHPYGRTYERGFFRPEDKSNRKPGTTENYGHPSALGGAMGRISGEILYDKATKTFTVNNKSGRYSKNNEDRTPEQLLHASKLIRQVVDPGVATWGPAFFLLEYGPEGMKEELMKRPDLAYDDAKKKSRPHFVVLPAGPSEVTPEVGVPKANEALTKPAAGAKKVEAAPAPSDPPKAKKTKKPKAANNDDPS